MPQEKSGVEGMTPMSIPLGVSRSTQALVRLYPTATVQLQLVSNRKMTGITKLDLIVHDHSSP